ncbi:MAG: Mu transposase C-terminal domain-containing protein [Rubrivivax sp.]
MLIRCPHAKRPKRKVIRGRGVNVNGIYYRHEALDRVRPGSTVEVRVEPYNASVVYVNVGDRWVAATGNSSRWLGQRTHYELECALREQQRLKQLNAKRDGGSTKSLKHKMVPLRPEDFDKRLALQQMELCYLDAQLGFGPALKGISAAQPAKQPAASEPAPAPVLNVSVASPEPEIPFPVAVEVQALSASELASSSPGPANEARYRRALEFGLR